MSTRSNKGIELLLVEPLNLERVIHRSKRAVDILQAAIGSVEIQASIDTIHPASIDTVHPTIIHHGTVHPGTVHRGTVLPPLTDCSSAIRHHLFGSREGCCNPDVSDVAETNDFYMNREWYDWGSVDPFQGLPHEDPRDLIKELEELASASEQNEVSVDHIICKIFPILYLEMHLAGSVSCSQDL
ncbi:hypothetical protein DY000_02016090 [Brassica cretica]|uniref:Uncharacterized protein n=1 Tax=Brassica cretica TaxID=69181 RepID=A0ABQ7D313_BRACR|nr:hypothetical protein DY000_02016090 [Brassica cretica]